MLATYNYRQATTANVGQTFYKHLDKTGVINAEDLPKMDYVVGDKAYIEHSYTS
jgi:hypothetical protein